MSVALIGSNPQPASFQTQKSAAVFAIRRANYTHRRKGVFNVQIIGDNSNQWQLIPRYQEMVTRQ
jgi:hypothetical protein